MKTGIIRRIDDLGRIVIPKEIRNKFNISEGDPLEISLDGNKICFELYIPSYEYEKSIKKIIKRLEQDVDLTTDKKEAISALQKAYKALRPTEKGGTE